jgi:ketosteroid isomerase-like protein
MQSPALQGIEMRTDRLRMNQLSRPAYDWYLSYLDSMDALDLRRYAAHLADECVLVMNNEAPMEGKQAIIAGLERYWQSFKSVEHDLLNIYGSDERFCLEALNHYERHDGKHVTLRTVAFTDRKPDGKVTAVRLYTDIGPLFA